MSQSPVDAVLQQLHKVRKSGPASWSARCPAHDDSGPSLAIRETDDGRVLMHCFAGCSVHNVLAAIGMDIGDLFPAKPQSPGAGSPRERRPWRASDLLRLASHESTVALLVAADIAAGRRVSDADRKRLLEASARLADIAHATNAV